MSGPRILTLTRESEAILEEYTSDFSLENTTEHGLRRLPRGILDSVSDEIGFWEELSRPVYLDSVEALHFIGVEKDAAETILRNYRNRPDGTVTPDRTEIDDLFGFIEGHLTGKEDAWDEDDEKREVALREMGMKESTRRGIMDPEFKNLPLSDTAKGWALDTLRNGWETIIATDKTVRAHRRQFWECAERRYDGGFEDEDVATDSILERKRHGCVSCLFRVKSWLKSCLR